ncbi:hypothetical protein [Actinoplanes sp. NPDC089786]|uniref:hypothetical protein n=1 Tax=Actinoplanes sp. NPDC089786 TaxID=3155185 RepID=UPI00343E46EC
MATASVASWEQSRRAYAAARQRVAAAALRGRSVGAARALRLALGTPPLDRLEPALHRVRSAVAAIPPWPLLL